MWNRREWARLCAATWLGCSVEAAAVAPAARGGTKPDIRQSALVMAVDNPGAFRYLPLTIAQRLGYFAAEGLNLQVRESATPGLALQAALDGSAQVLSGSYCNSVLREGRGYGLQSLVIQTRAPQIVMGLAQKWAGDFRGWRDLRGRRIGVPGLGSPCHRIARLVLAKGGLAPSDVSFHELPRSAGALEAFRSGVVDAICYTDPTITELEQAGLLKVLVDTRTVRGNADLLGGPLPTACLSAKREWIETHPREAQAMADAIVRSLKWLQTAGPSDIIKVVPEAYFRGDRALYLAAFSRAREGWSPDGLMPSEGPGVAARVLSQLDGGAVVAREDLGASFTNQFALKAKTRFRA